MSLLGSKEIKIDEFIEQWSDEFSDEMIIEACNMSNGSHVKNKLAYINGILNNWKRLDIKTIEQIKHCENINTIRQNNKSTKSTFNNYNDQEIDFDEITRLERIYIGLV